jgi:hypothetical protein
MKYLHAWSIVGLTTPPPTVPAKAASGTTVILALHGASTVVAYHLGMSVCEPTRCPALSEASHVPPTVHVGVVTVEAAGTAQSPTDGTCSPEPARFPIIGGGVGMAS